MTQSQNIIMKTHLLIAIFSLLSFAFFAQDGTLDTSFGNGGTVRIPYYEKDAQILTILKVDDAIFSGGYTKETKEDFTIVKMDLDGNLDSNFGENGTLRFVIGQGFGRCSKLLQHPDGGLLAIGWDRNGNKDEYILIKMDINGNLDTSFGDAGIASGNWSSSSYAESEIADAAFLSDGRLIASGRSYNGSNTDFVVACYDADGNPCADFGTNGIIIQLFNDTDHWEIAQELVVDYQDNIYVSGENRDDEDLVVKYDSNGDLVSSFGTEGILVFTHSTHETTDIGDLAVDYNNRLLVSGIVNMNSNFGYIARYDNNGNLDTSFGNQGEVVLSSVNSLRITDAKIIDDNALLVVGKTSGFATKQILAKLDNTGNLVTNFGINGIATLQLASTFTTAAEMAIDAESIYVGGDTYESDYFEFAVTKYSNQLVNSEDIFDDQLKINLYPNPVANQLYLGVEDGMKSINIYDTNGKMIYTEEWSQAQYNHDINTNAWHNGIYSILVKSGNNLKTIRFVKI